MKRTRLSIRKETLAELGTGDLSRVAGAAITHGCTIYPTLAGDPCVYIIAPPTFDRCPLTGNYPTLPVNDCVRPE